MKSKNNDSKTGAVESGLINKNAGSGSEENRTVQTQSIKASIVAELHNRESKLRFKVL